MFSGEGLPFGRHSDVLNASASDDESLMRLVEELKRRGNTAFQQKAFEEAEALYSKAIEVNGSNPLKNQHIFFANRSASRKSMGKTQLALDDAVACVALEPTYAKGYFRQAQALNKLKRYKEALAALTEALTLEPGNKSVHTLFGQVHELALKEEEAPAVPAAPSSLKKLTRTEVVKETTSPTATKTTTSSSSVEKVEADDEDIGGTVRGYKKLADGRVTTFFNNELTEEARQLIGDIAPKKVEDANAVQIKSVEGGSAWNVGNTFEEKDMTAWAKSKFETLFTGVSAALPASAGVSGVVNAGTLSDVTGDASIAVVRGAKRYIFDFAFTLKCALQLENGDTTEGELKFLDVSSDSDGDYDAEAVVASRYQTAAGKALHAALSSPSSPFRAALKAQLDHFVKEYHTF